VPPLPSRFNLEFPVFWLASVVRLLKRDEGQDLIEYGLLCAAVAAIGVALFPNIVTHIQLAFQGWNTAVNGKWIPPNP
jgi:Flp pilus assembly pilin Flp